MRPRNSALPLPLGLFFVVEMLSLAFIVLHHAAAHGAFTPALI